MKARGASPAFTLIELMVTLAILAIMMAVGVPSFKNFIGSQKVKSASYEMMTSAVIARSEAIKRNTTTVAITPTNSNWAYGWTVAAGTTTLHRQESVAGMSVDTYKDGTCSTSGTVASITYGTNGRPSNATSVCFKFSSPATTTTRCVKLDLTGIPTTITCP